MLKPRTPRRIHVASKYKYVYTNTHGRTWYARISVGSRKQRELIYCGSNHASDREAAKAVSACELCLNLILICKTPFFKAPAADLQFRCAQVPGGR